MKRLILSLILSSLLFQAFSQKVYFVYIQTESEKPFFVRLNDKTYSSTASGYIILSKLRDSTHHFSIGFPNNASENKFSVIIGSKDHGYILKNFGEKGWGLFDLQTLSIQMAKQEDKQHVTIKEEVSKFTEILAKAVDDSTLLQKQLPVKTEEKKSETVSKPLGKNEEVKNVVQVSQPVKEEPKESKINEQKVGDSASMILQKMSSKIETYKKSTITRKSQSSTSEGFGMTFIDKQENGLTDTIAILIPDIKPAVKEMKSDPVEEKKFLEITNVSGVLSKSDSTLNEKVDENKTEKILYTNNCPAVANETDFLELRRKMATATNDDGMLTEASKFYKTKCFYTAQIKNLSVLFLNDESKYRFFDISYKYVADIENFASLQSEMKDEYYINRFKAMLRQ